MIKRHILLIDDDSQTRTLVKFMVEQAGYVVKCGKDGYEAVELVKDFAFDLVILDINMPFVNGFDVAKTLQKISTGANVPILFISGRDDLKSIKKSIDSGGTDYVIKPVERDVLLKKVERILGSRPQYYEVQLVEADKLNTAKLTYDVSIESISESGMVIHSPIPLEITHEVNNLNIDLFAELGISSHNLIVYDCAKQDEGYTIYCSFINLPKPDIGKIREWVVETKLKSNKQ